MRRRHALFAFLALQAVVFATLIFVSGCSGSPAGIDRAGFAVNVCAQGRWDELAGVTLAPGTGYLQLDVATSGAVGESLQGVSHVGTSCAAAADVPACTLALERARSDVGWKRERCGGAGCTTELRFFVRENGGVVGTATRLDELVPLLVPIDSPAEAALVAAFAFEPPSIDCNAPQVSARAVDGSYDVFLADGGGCTDRVERRVHVTMNGAVTELEKATIAATQECVSP